MNHNNITCIQCNREIDTVNPLLCFHCGKVPVNQNFNYEISQAREFLGAHMHAINELRHYLASLGITVEGNIFLDFINSWNVYSYATSWSLNNLLRNDVKTQIMLSNPHLDSVIADNLIIGFEGFFRKSYLTNILFELENFLTKLDKYVPSPSNIIRYEPIVKNIIEQLELETLDSDVRAIFLLPAYIRNTQHTGGIHQRSQEPTFKIREINFKIKRNIQHDYASWRHVSFYFDNIFAVVKLMIQNNPKCIVEKTKRNIEENE